MIKRLQTMPTRHKKMTRGIDKESKMKKILLFFAMALLVLNTAGTAQSAQSAQTTQETQEEQTKQATQVEEVKQEEPAKKEEPVKPEDLNLGRIYFPRAFVHAGKNYDKGVYRMSLTEKEGVPWFKVFDKKKELLFEEMAVVKPYKGKSRRFRFRIRKQMLKGYEYFRITVTKPDKRIIAYFFVKQEEPPKPSEPEPGSETPPQ
jgi:hypothetical protein